MVNILRRGPNTVGAAHVEFFALLYDPFVEHLVLLGSDALAATVVLEALVQLLAVHLLLLTVLVQSFHLLLADVLDVLQNRLVLVIFALQLQQLLLYRLLLHAVL